MARLNPDDPRTGGGDLLGKLRHATVARGDAEARALGLERQLAEQAKRYQATILELRTQLQDFERRCEEQRLELDFLMAGAAAPDAAALAAKATGSQGPASACVVELCTCPATLEGHCDVHRWIVEGER